MSSRLLERLLWAATAALLCLAGVQWRRSQAALPLETDPMEPVLASPKRVSNSVLRAAAGVVEHGDVFRLDRVPAPVPFGQLPSSDVAPVPAPPAPARPPLALQGIVGPPWQAVVEGLPDQEGPVVVRGGERFGELKVRSVSRDHVVVVGSDTVWRLTVRNPWQ